MSMITELIERLREAADFRHTVGDYMTAGLHREAATTIEQLAAKVRPKTGYWRPVYQGDYIINYRCTECDFGNTFGKNTYRMNYCPNCGARMVDPQESEE